MASGDATNVYDNGVLINAFPGTPVEWFDDDRLLVELDGAWRIYDSSGALQPTPSIKAFYSDNHVHLASATELYSQEFGAIYSLLSGEELWNCGPAWGGLGTAGSAHAGTAAAHYAVFVSEKGPQQGRLQQVLTGSADVLLAHSAPRAPPPNRATASSSSG